MMAQIIVAAVGTDGVRPVVWGVGAASTESAAGEEALEEARHELRQAGLGFSEDTDAHNRIEIRTVEIDEHRRQRIIEGDVGAEDLWSKGL